MADNGIAGSIRKWVDKVCDPHQWQSFCNPKELDIARAVAVGPASHVPSSADHVENIVMDDDRKGGKITFLNGDTFEGNFCTSKPSDREGCHTTIGTTGQKVEIFGKWVADLLEGFVETVSREDGVAQSMYREGILHGSSRIFGPAKGRSDNLRLLAFYNSGQVQGHAWLGLIGGAFLIGPLDAAGQVCAPDAVYLYPDLSTAIIGHFEEGQMLSGHYGDVADISFDENHILVPKIKRRPFSEMITRDVATNKVISKTPGLQDEFEAQRVQVKLSLMDAGEGLFAKSNFKCGQLLALFNGIRLQSQRLAWSASDLGSDYLIRLNGQLDLDIPEDCTHLSQYCATLGHKANHSFTPNAKWTRLEHPRFGLICSLTAIADIKAGDEILVNYGMQLSSSPMWYKELFVRHCRESKGMSDDQIRDWCGRQYAIHGRVIELPLVSPSS